MAKDADGDVVALELSDLPGEDAAEFDALGAAPAGLFNDEDLAAAGEELEPNTSAALLVWENVWAKGLADAIAGSGGELLDYDRIPRDIVQEAIDWASTNY